MGFPKKGVVYVRPGARKSLGESRGRRTSEYRAWRDMRARCCNPNHGDYADYGGRGITVCERWRSSYVAFLEDMGRRPSQLHSLDRENNDASYSPDNCRWATPMEQAANRRTTQRLTFQGQTVTTRELADLVGVHVLRLRWRLSQGWPIEKAVLPVKERARR